jgi:hypothetical protein
LAKPALNDNAMYAYRYYIDKYKLKPYQAAGIVGNLMQESTFNTGARNKGDGSDGSDSVGIGQWNGERARNLKAFGGDNYTNLDTQLDFVMHEMNGEKGPGAGSERAAWQNLQKATDVHGATAAMIGFERPSGWKPDNPTAGHGFDNRFGWAGEVMGMTPEQIAAAQPTSALAAQTETAQATANPNAGKPYEDGLISFLQNKANPDTAPKQGEAAPAVEGGKEVERGLLEKMGIGKMPGKVFGVDTKKGLNVMGALNDSMEAQAKSQNATVAQAAQLGAIGCIAQSKCGPG